MSDRVTNGAARVRCFCGTTHTSDGFSERDILTNLEQFAREQEQVRFFIGQLEQCPDTGRVHCQWYVQLHNPGTIASLKRKLRRVDERLNTSHLEVAQGSADDNIAYCSKESSRYVPDGSTVDQNAIRVGQVHRGAGRGAGE